MAEILIVYTTLQGHTLRVAERVAESAADAGHRPTLARVEAAPALGPFDAVIVGAPVQAGAFAEPVVAFAKEHAADLGRVPTGLFFVCLTSAGDDGASRATVDGYLRAFQSDTHWRPDVIASFAGTLRHPHDSLLHRALMRDAAPGAPAREDPAARPGLHPLGRRRRLRRGVLAPPRAVDRTRSQFSSSSVNLKLGTNASMKRWTSGSAYASRLRRIDSSARSNSRLPAFASSMHLR